MKYQDIKEDMIEKAMELWGIEDAELIDPVIGLLLDVFSYEFAKIEQDIKLSDSKLLERISKILVQESWSLPLPAHALLRAVPSDKFLEVSRDTQFYIQKMIDGDQYIDIFFTPLSTHKLISGHIACVAKHKSMQFFDTNGRNLSEIDTINDKKIADYSLWMGIDIDRTLLNKVTELPLALILRDSNIDRYLKLIKFFDIEGNEIKCTPIADTLHNSSKEHYFDAVVGYYQNYLYTLELVNKKTKKSVSSKFESYFFEEDIEEFNAELFWIKIEFPVAFTKSELDKLDISMNTFPITNRKLQYKQHSIKRNGKIASLRTLNEHFLNVESLIDNEGRTYKNTLTNDINNLKGTYSLYFGELEQFDERNAKAILEQVIQTVREEGSSFSAIGYDLLNAYLEDLNKKLNIIERKISVGYKNVSNSSNRQYLLTIPFDDSAYLECQFWTTDAIIANNIKRNSVFGQFHTSELIAKTIRLQTDTVGGSIKNDAKEKVSNLRYGLLSKDRIVSVEDVKEFIRKSIGKTIDRVEVKSGVGFSPNKKGGLIRTTHVEIHLNNDKIHTSENKKRLSNSLQQELEQKSVHNLPYVVSIH
ncbi:MAG: hypothetical protein ACPGTO_03135 [Polaribacter sp.]